MIIKSTFSLTILMVVFGLTLCTNKDQKNFDEKANMNIKASTEAKKQAINAAMKWLKMIDDKKYTEAWNNSAELFKKITSQDSLESTLDTIRGSFGRIKLRKFNIAIYKTSLDGAPDGEYFVIKIHSSFENKKKSIEIVTSMKEKSGDWKVAGYRIK